MKREQVAYLSVIGVVAMLSWASQAFAREPGFPTRCKLVDLGSLGGPISYGSLSGDGMRLLSQNGTVVRGYPSLCASVCSTSDARPTQQHVLIRKKLIPVECATKTPPSSPVLSGFCKEEQDYAA